MNFALEPLAESLVAEMTPLWRAHYEEIATYKDIPLDPDLGRYHTMAEKGMLRIFTVRDGDVLVGYQVMFVMTHPHYQQTLCAYQDILFLDEAVRLGSTAYRFINWCDGKLKAENVEVVYQHLKAKHDFGHLLERMGYELQEKLYSRRVN